MMPLTLAKPGERVDALGCKVVEMSALKGEGGVETAQLAAILYLLVRPNKYDGIRLTVREASL